MAFAMEMQNAVTRWQWPSVSASFKSSALFHQLLEISLIRAVFHDQAAMLQGAPDAEEKLVLLKRLQNIVVSAPPYGLQGCGNVVNRGDHNYRDFRVVLA